jgi:hypothetical protein
VRNEKKQAFIDGILVKLYTGVVLSIASFLYDDTTIPPDIINNLCPTVSFLLYPKDEFIITEPGQARTKKE